MNIKINLPNIFVPMENEFQLYCAIKLYKGNYITKEEAMYLCGLKEVNDNNVTRFNNLYHNIEKRYIKQCGDGYSDEDFLNEMNI